MFLFLQFMFINLGFIVSISIPSSVLGPVTSRKCQPQLIKVEQCRDKFYKYTSLPNLMGQDQETDIQSQIDMFSPLLNQKCSNELNFLLCSVFTPICDPEAELLLGPCSGICQKVQSECEPVLRVFNLPWPAGLNCSRFPKQSTPDLMCMSNPRVENRTRKSHIAIELGTIFDHDASSRSSSNVHNGKCRHLRQSEKYVFINRTGRCALKCLENDLFTKETKRFAEIWMSVLAVLTFFSTLFTCLTCFHSHKISYPEQPIIFLALSYNLYSISMILRLFFSRSTVSCDYDPVSGQQILIQEGLENTHCALSFLLNFFFSTATHIWWVTLTGCWMAFSAFKISPKSLTSNAGYLHLFVWLSTSMLTVSVLVLRCVEADELLGVCSVGGQSPDLLMTFSIIPKSISLVLGMFFLCLGFVFMKKQKKNVKTVTKKGLPSSMTTVTSIAFRVALFSGVYILAISILIACQFYQYLNYNTWKWAQEIFRNSNEPVVAVFLLGIFMNQVVGINTAIWIWSLDAAASWRRVFRSLKMTCQRKTTISQRPFQDQKLFDSSQKKYCQYSKAGEDTLYG